MPRPSVRWRLEGGYSHLLDRARVEVTLEEGPTHQQLMLTPLGMSKRPTELVLRVSHGFKARGPGNLRWKLEPGARIRAIVLQPGNAYLGNFRVPEGQFAIQWDVAGEVSSTALRRFSSMLVSAEAGSTVVQSWVTLLSGEVSLLSAIRQSWKSYVDPFDPKEVSRLSDRQVTKFRWSGRLGASIGVEWGIGTGWQVGASKAFLKLQTALKAQVALKAKLEISQSGSFALQLSRRDGEVRLSISEDRRSQRLGRLAVRATLRNTIKLQPQWSVLAPLLAPLNAKLAEAVAKRFEIAFVLESERSRRHHLLLSALWKRPTRALFVEEYGGLLSGSLPGLRPGLKVTGRIEVVRGERVDLALNLLSWIHLGKSSEKKRFFHVDLGPRGELTVEEGRFSRKTSYRWEELQLVSLLCAQRSSGTGSRNRIVWTFEKKREFRRAELVRLLKKALHLRSISEFELPGPKGFPLELELCWCSEFTEKGIEVVKSSLRQEKWNALVTALALAEPENYGPQGSVTDWISSSRVRESIDLNPVQSHLESIYPLRGRSASERKQVVSTYLRVKRLLHLAELWEQGDQDQLIDALDLGWEVPIFFWFHLLCPAEFRRSAVILRGGLNRVWGAPEVLTDG